MTDTKPERRLTTVSEQAFHFAALLKPDGEILDIDRQALRFWGLRPEDVKGKRIWEIGWRLAHDEDASRLQAAIDSGAAGRMLRGESAVWDTDQQATLLSFSLRPVKDRNGQVVLLVANARSLSRHQRTGMLPAASPGTATRSTAAPDRRARAALDQVDQAVIVLDDDHLIEFANPAAGAMLSSDRNAIVGQPLTTVLQRHGADTAPLSAFLTGRTAADDACHRQTVRVARGEQTYALQLICSAAPGADGGYVVVLKSQGAVPTENRPDPLTGLPCRSVVLDQLEQALSTGPGGNHCFCYLDLDAFQQIEEHYGHESANDVITAVAQELKQHARRGDLLARISGDAFGLLLRDCSLDNARAVCDALLRTVQDVHPAGAATDAPQLSASIGLVPLSAAGSGEGILQLAKHACTDAKEAGGNRLQIADAAAIGSRRRKHRPTLRTQRLRLLLQPLAALDTGEPPAHAEVLLRVSDKVGRLGSPAAFIADADHAELAAELDRWVIGQVCIHAGRHGDRPAAAQIVYSINLSAQSVRDPVLPAYCIEQCNQHGVEPGRLCFELSESLALSEPRALEFMQRMRAEGFAIALDDCGSTGAKLVELRALPVDYLKIGGTLIQALTEDPVDGVLVDAINRVAHLSGMRTVAKWVEDNDVLDRVRAMKLDYAQGFSIAEPQRIS